MTDFRWRHSGPPQTWFLDFAFLGDGTSIAGGDDLIGIYRSRDGRSDWKLVLGDFSAWCFAVAADESFILSGDPYGRGVVRSVDRGLTWQRANKGFPAGNGGVGAAGMHASIHDSEVAFAAIRATSNISKDLGAGLWRTGDGGKSWELAGLGGLDVAAVHQSGHDPKLLLAGLGGRTGTGRGLFVSEDSGSTWSEVTMPETAVINFLSDPDDAGRFYMAASGGVYVSEDRGSTWRLGGDGHLTWGVRRDPIEPSRFYSVSIAGESCCMVSEDRCESWRASSLRDKTAIGIGVDPVGTVLIGTYGYGTYRSADRGETWVEVGGAISHSYVYSQITIDPRDADRLIVPVHYGPLGGGIYISPDAGLSWSVSKTPKPKTVGNLYQVKLDPRDPDHLFCAYLESGNPRTPLVESKDGGRSWKSIGPKRRDGVSCAIDPEDPSRIWCGTTAGVIRSDDAGRTWSDRGLEDQYVASFTFLAVGDLLAACGGTNWGSNRPGGFFSTSDSGDSWTQLEVAKGMGGYAVAADATDPSRLYFAHEEGLSLSADGGTTSSLLLDRPGDTGSCVVVDPSDGAIYYCGNNYIEFHPGALLRSRDGGATWEDISGDCMTREIWWLTIDPGRRLYGSAFGSGLWILDLVT